MCRLLREDWCIGKKGDARVRQRGQSPPKSLRGGAKRRYHECTKKEENQVRWQVLDQMRRTPSGVTRNEEMQRAYARAEGTD